MNDLLNTFFSKNFENDINEKMMYYSYSFEHHLINEYIEKLLSTPLVSFLNFIFENYKVPYLEAVDVVQFSNIEDCTAKICTVIKEAGDKGYTSLEVGKLLENDGIVRKDGAYLKYGENQAKTAVQFGLLTQISNKFFLSCIGYVFADLTEDEQRRLLTRLILRNKLVQRLFYKAEKNGSSEYLYETGFLSETTRLRRKSNVKTIISFVCNTDEMDLSGMLSKIMF